MKNFVLDGRYEELLTQYNLNIEEALKKADLPEDTLKKLHPIMNEQEYYNFLEAIGSQIEDDFTPIKIATTSQIESFSPPIFAAYCSKNGHTFIKRLAKYKKLIGPLTFKVNQDEKTTSITLIPSDNKYILPKFVALTEFAFLIGLIRKTTKSRISPQKITFTFSEYNYETVNFFNTKIEKSTEDTITFFNQDLDSNFVSYNQAMWDYFKPELTKRLSELAIDESMSSRVRSALVELLPSGEFTIDDVAKKLGYSKRTLQRKLSSEKTSFQKQLNSTREMLAINYLKNTDMTTNDIAYLLGYQELNSFLRAFSIWKGMSVSEYLRKEN